MNLLEQYKQRLDVADRYYQNNHAGQRLDGTKKIAVATCLNNINKFMNESFGPAATQQSDMGTFKKFCLNITTLGVPNTIASELVMVQPMTSYTGFVTFTDFVAGDDKGGVQAGQLFNGVYGLGKMDPDRMNYSAATVIETVKEDGKVAWMRNGVVGAFGKVSEDEKAPSFHEGYVQKKGAPLLTKLEDVAEGDEVTYVYDNVTIPQEKLVHLKAVQHSVSLRAKCRRLTVTYSQIAAFQAQTDYGMDLNQQLVAQASGELSYEIDSEIVDLLASAAVLDSRLHFSRTLPVGVSRRDHYEGFTSIVEMAKAIVYNRTKRFQPNYMVCASDVLEVLAMNSQWTAAPAGVVNGPYFAGTFGALKVFVSPMMGAGEFFVGVNGNDLTTSAAIYAPYMPIVPTQLLGLPDGTLTQGFATLYDLKLLARAVAINEDGSLDLQYDAEGNTLGDVSPLLVAGKIEA